MPLILIKDQIFWYLVILTVKFLSEYFRWKKFPSIKNWLKNIGFNCSFGSNCTFGGNCVFGNYCLLRDGIHFQNATFGKSCFFFANIAKRIITKSVKVWRFYMNFVVARIFWRPQNKKINLATVFYLRTPYETSARPPRGRPVRTSTQYEFLVCLFL